MISFFSQTQYEQRGEYCKQKNYTTHEKGDTERVASRLKNGLKNLCVFRTQKSTASSILKNQVFNCPNNSRQQEKQQRLIVSQKKAIRF